MSDAQTFSIDKAWYRWPEETDTAYDRFTTYLEMGSGRSMTKVVQKYDKKDSYKNQLGKWSSKFDWVDRCKAYDEHIATQHVENQEIIQKKARSKILSRLDEAVDKLYEIALSNDPDRMQALEMIMLQAGMINQGEEAKSGEMPTYQMINNYFADK